MKKRNPVRVLKTLTGAKVTYASCEIFCTSPTVCPLCGLTIPAKTPHSCRKPQ